MARRTHLLWLRNDLRLDDNPALHAAAEGADRLLCVACIDPRWLRPPARLDLGFAKLGPHWLRFRLESLHALREALRERGSDLHVVVGEPAVALPPLFREVGASAIFHAGEDTREELDDEAALRAELPHPVRRVEERPLLHPDDLPFVDGGFPDSFTQFRRAVEGKVPVRDPQPAPAQLPPPPEAIGLALPPGLGELGIEAFAPDGRAVLPFDGGEAAARERLRRWVWTGRHILHYKDSRNGLLGADYSSKFSPWLAHGCLSPRRVWSEVLRFEEERRANQGTYWLRFELLWRDFFRHAFRATGDRLFRPRGLAERAPATPGGRGEFGRWRLGQVGEPFVDANMVELARTGFMSNRGRQVVASYLVHDLGVDWRWGAAWFEHCLLDFDPCSNYGNWAYVAGVGHDPRSRRFSVERQVQQYDRNGEYVQTWLEGAPAQGDLGL